MNTILFVSKDTKYRVAEQAFAEVAMVVTRHKGNLYEILKNRYDEIPERKITEKTLDKHIKAFYHKSLIPAAY
jgi:hypothetical protein